MTLLAIKRGVKFTIEEAQAAGDAWRFNCGPAALCAILGKKPEEIRPHLLDFEAKGYTNPSLMACILHDLGVDFRRVYEGVHPPNIARYPDFGLVRVQWGGPWTKDGVPMRARYRHTHWIATRRIGEESPDGQGREVFDVNAMSIGGWLPWIEWESQLVPWLLKQVEPKGNGDWWPTHCWEIE